MSYSFRIAALAMAILFAPGAFAQDAAPAQDATPAPDLPPADAATGSETAENGVTTYPISFFLDLGALSAQEIVRLVPGFAFKNADDSRGYAGVGGNVLINGRRPSTKTTQLRQLLQRIPASAIDRVEVIRGGTPGIDMQGETVVVNLVRKSGAFDTGALDGVLKYHPTGDVSFIGRVERSRRSDDLFLEGFLDLRREINDDKAGRGPVTRLDAAGNITEVGRYIAENVTKRINGLGTLEKETSNGLLRVNLALVRNEDDDPETIKVRDLLGVQSEDVVDGVQTVSRVESGADYEARLNDRTSYQLVALQTLSRKESDKTRDTTDVAQRSTLDEKSGETILRGLIRRHIAEKFDLETGAEGAYNFLDSNSTLTENGQAIQLPAADIRVEELRSETFATLMMQASARASLEWGLRAETSTITVTGDAEAENRFSFLKPRFVAAYTSEHGVQLRFRTEREVGQLQFEDFAAGSELADNTVSAGNPNLVPERGWVYEAAYEQPLPGGSVMALTVRHYELEDVVDLVPVEGYAAPGNIGDGTRDEVGVSMSMPLDSIGPGLGRLQLSGTFRDSEVTDPFTGETREISGEGAFDGEILYTRDFPSIDGTLTVRGELTSKETAYRLDQVIATRNENFWRATWDWRAKPTLLVRIGVENFTSRDRWLHRVRYDGSRTDGVIDSRERRSAVYDPDFVIRARWTF